MNPMVDTKQKISCPECGKEMYRLSGSSEPIYVCPKCGNSIDNVYAEPDLFGKDNRKISEKKQLMQKLFPDYFMKKYTDFDTFSDFIHSCSFITCEIKDISNETFEHLPKGKWDRFVKKNTMFSSWDEMFEYAVERYLKL